MSACLASLLLFASFLVGCSHLAPEIKSQKPWGQLAIMQGATSSTEASFVVAVPRQDKVVVELIDPVNQKILVKGEALSIEHLESQWKLVQFQFDKLRPRKVYDLMVRERWGRWQDKRSFRTLAREPATLRLALTSCMRDDDQRLAKIWQALASKKPDLIFMIGDNSYVDFHGLAPLVTNGKPPFWKRHMETRLRLPIFREQMLTPVFATWDDHDYGVNNGDRSFPWKSESTRTFSAFFPMRLKAASWSRGPGVSAAFSVGDQRFLFLDNRSFRSPKGAGPSATHFGARQTRWLHKQLRSGELNWLISGDQFFGGYHPFDSFAGHHPIAFKKLLGTIKKAKKKVLFVSGDRHISELMAIPKSELGYKTYEITASPMHSKVYPGAIKKNQNPLQLKGVDGRWNFVLVDVKRDKSESQLFFKAVGENNRVLFQKAVRL